MNALDQFFEQRNSAILLQCLGEKISINFDNKKTDNNKIKGIFISTNINSMDKILIQEDNLMCLKKEINITEEDDFEFFKIENINLNLKKPLSKYFIYYKLIN